MLMKRLSRSILLIAAACLCPIANAKWIGYDLTLEVTQESHSDDPCAYPLDNLVFRCDVAVGDTFVGSFFIEETLLSKEGDALVGEIHNFMLPFAGLVYDQNLQWPTSALQGFVGPLVDGGTPLIGAPSPGFNVHGGVLTGLIGGVFGIVDTPFVDFSLFGAGTFFATDLVETTIAGTMVVGRNGQVIPEPATFLLLAAGLAGMGLARHRRRLSRESRQTKPHSTSVAPSL